VDFQWTSSEILVHSKGGQQLAIHGAFWAQSGLWSRRITTMSGRPKVVGRAALFCSSCSSLLSGCLFASLPLWLSGFVARLIRGHTCRRRTTGGALVSLRRRRRNTRHIVCRMQVAQVAQLAPNRHSSSSFLLLWVSPKLRASLERALSSAFRPLWSCSLASA